MFYLTRKEQFNSAHKLYNPNWSREKNEEVFGPCANENWHGHNFDLFITVKGKPDPDTGFVMNAKDLGAIIKDKIIEKLDHKNLNLEVDFLKDKLCSVETIAFGIWNEMEKCLPENVQMHCVRLHETQKIYVEYFGE
ncbi:6-pyruvoyl tetrahydropterin synthase family protein [Haoranjiania flava]|uniref:6-carboxy-5,6,7,8-tetrahydropterin synthase n=1 Tax=Haoranjiania flava TaxID=1856322 RepID=A0AAE3IPC8_9BACT|nr:6-carboxytetrahydropterin synthase [Haoranjiania flava]MCU7693362.1 6-carboxytetrahydropterin synthase [Haoranjiania flava]